MPRERNYREAESLASSILRCRAAGMIQREIAATLGIKRALVAHYLTRAKATARVVDTLHAYEAVAGLHAN